MKLRTLIAVKSVKAAALVATVVLGATSASLLMTSVQKLSLPDLLGPKMIQTSQDTMPTFEYSQNEKKFSPDGFMPVIRLKTKKDGQFFCSAFVISDVYAMTAAHCLVNEGGFMKKEDLEVSDMVDQDTGVVATPAAVNLRVDYGLVMGDFKSFNRVPLKHHLDGFLGSRGPFSSWGYPWGGEMEVVRMQILPEINKGFEIHMIGPIYPGMSGGPVIDESTGQAVGINHAADPYGGILIAPIVEALTAMSIPVNK